jgi:hypothetical protein
MIPILNIKDWEKEHPWKKPSYIEQDLILSRAIVEIFSDDLLRKSLIFRGGTALHKLFIHPQVRYSEDIDLIQINREPINPVLKRIREVLSFLGAKRTVKQHIHNNTMIYRFDTEIPPVMNMRLKIEINTREHLNVLGLQEIPYEVKNGWFSGACNVTVYTIEEMLGLNSKHCIAEKRDAICSTCTGLLLIWKSTAINFCIVINYTTNTKDNGNQPLNNFFAIWKKN